MPDGIYAAASGLQAQQIRLDALANDLANVDTPGYASERVAFSDLVSNQEDGVPVGAGAKAVTLGRSFVQGPLAENGDPLSLALQGPGFFQVKRSDGTVALTRDGDFSLDAKGAIVTKSGERLEPPLQLPVGSDLAQLKIAADGSVTLQGKTIGKLSIVDVPAPGALRSVGGGLFVVTSGSGAAGAAPKATTVVQGSLEQSNVDLSAALTGLLDAQRAYELASRAVQTQDQLLQIANQIRR